MNCQEFAAVLDENRLGSLGQDARSAVDAHAAACRPCAEALAADEALARDPIPAATAALDVADLLRRHEAGARAAVPLSPRRRARLRRVAAVSLLGFAGAALAATALFTVHAAWQRAHGGDTTKPAAPSADQAATSASATSPAATSPIAYVQAAERAERKRFNAALMSSPDLPDGDFFPLLHVAPSYPPAAAARKLEGFAIGEFTVTADGDVANVHIVKSSDPVFDAPTIEAIAASKYKPRIVGGKAVPVPRVRLKIAYVMQRPHSAAATKKPAPKPPPPQDALSRQQFFGLLAKTTSCLRTNDVQCVELNLDQIRAIHPLTRGQQDQLLRIEGFVQLREGNYERAIAAYRKAADLEAEEGVRRNTLWILAHIYYERQQYQPALDTAVRFLKSASHPSLAEYVFVDRLRQLGAVVR